jgi:hypothetical protein
MISCAAYSFPLKSLGHAVSIPDHNIFKCPEIYAAGRIE